MRPALHFTARSGWINDPHGITVHEGRYHAFFQYVPGSTVWAPDCHWGHAVGADLLSLRELPVAIAPGQGDDGIWTGSLVVDGPDTRIFYTSTTVPDFGIGRIRVATPDDDGWVRWSKGSFVADVPEGLDVVAYRDPFVRREDDGWRMFVGAGLRDGTAMALSYTSPDLRTWTYAGVALQRSTHETEPVWMGALWECPQIFTIGGRGVMVSSVWDADVLHYAGYAIGRYAAGEFQADAWGRLTYGDSLYAPSLFFDADGEPCLTFWMRGVADVEAGWASAHSIPYRLRLEDDVLVAQPHPDVARHRAGEAADGRVDGLAADIEWSGADGVMTIASGGAPVATIRRAADGVVVGIGGRETAVPASAELRIVVDVPVIELSSAAGVFGAPIAPAGDALTVAATAGTLRAYRLR